MDRHSPIKCYFDIGSDERTMIKKLKDLLIGIWSITVLNGFVRRALLLKRSSRSIRTKQYQAPFIEKRSANGKNVGS